MATTTEVEQRVFWSVARTARALDCSETTVWELLRTGVLTRHKILTMTRIDPVEVQALKGAKLPDLAKRKAQQPASA